MTDSDCVNCNRPATGTYDLLLRNTDHRSVPLCSECYEAIQRETAD